MSFVGCISVLKEKGGLVLWLECAFTGVPKMLTVKKLEMNVPALRFIVLKLMRGFVNNITSLDKLQEKLDSIY